MRLAFRFNIIVLLMITACTNTPPTKEDALMAVTVMPVAGDNLPQTMGDGTDNDGLSVFNCDELETITDLSVYEPTQGAYVQVEENGFTLYDEPFTVYGINYTPRDYPGERFLAQTNLISIGTELDLMRAAGINLLRIPIRNYQLFACSGKTAVPVPEVLDRLDGVIYAAGQRGFKLILVLNVSADSAIYGDTGLSLGQIAYIAQRYRDESAVMAYDVRENGDQDYGDDLDMREIVLTWLARATSQVREQAPNQLVTAGWDNQNELTSPLVDFLSFQTDGDLDGLRQEIAVLTDATTKPILLAHVAYDTYALTEFEQRDALYLALEAVERNGLAGWVVYTGFDHPLSTLCEESPCEFEPQARSGLWNTSYYPKRAVDALKSATGVVTRSELESP